MLSTRGGINGEPVPATFNPRGRGKIINIASLCTYQGGLTVPAYASAKVSIIRKRLGLSCTADPLLPNSTPLEDLCVF